jgi:acid stress chaperone HdeB
MRRVFGVLLVAAVLLASAAVQAQDNPPMRVDMRAYTCGEFLKEQQYGMVLALFWLDGYASGKSGNTLLDSQLFDRYGEIMIRQCTKTPQAKVLDVFNTYARR